MLERIRKRVGQYYFKKDSSQLERSVTLKNLDQAKKIGILYTLEDVPDYDRVSAFVTQLQGEQKEVKALGFVKNKSLIERFLPKLSFDFFSRRDISWFYRPMHSTVRDFIDKEFDILIDLSLHDSFALKYIAGMSNALCRVGRFSEENTEYYDLMIDVKPSMSSEDYLGQIRHYLTIINKHAKRS